MLLTWNEKMLSYKYKVSYSKHRGGDNMITAQEFKSPYYNLKEIIQRKGLTQSKIADELGIDRSTFNLKINRTNGRDFTFEEAIRLSKMLNEKIEYFF